MVKTFVGNVMIVKGMGIGARKAAFLARDDDLNKLQVFDRLDQGGLTLIPGLLRR